MPPDLVEAVLVTLAHTYAAGPLGEQSARDNGALPERVMALIAARRGVRL